MKFPVALALLLAATNACANGRFDEARDYQARAIAKLDANESATRKRMQERLALYRKRRDWVQDYDAMMLPQ